MLNIYILKVNLKAFALHFCKENLKNSPKKFPSRVVIILFFFRESFFNFSKMDIFNVQKSKPWIFSSKKIIVTAYFNF